MTMRPAVRLHAARRSRGYTVVELMVSIVIGLFLLGGLISLLVTNSVNSAELNKTGMQIENGRYAMQVLIEDVQHAGYWGSYSPITSNTYSIPTASDLCDTTTAAFSSATPANLPVGLFGYDGTETTPTCTPLLTSRRTGTDIIVVRRLSTTSIPIGSAVTNETYMQSGKCSVLPAPPPFVISTNSGAFTLKKKNCTTDETIQKYLVHIYYIADCNVCGTDDIPTLKMAELVAGSFVITPLVEGIENLQVAYGLDTNFDGAPDCYTSNPTSVPTAEKNACAGAATYFTTATATKNWSNVAAARINVLARNLQKTAGWTDSRSYDLGLAGTVSAPNDGYKRHVYAATARVYNLSSAREVP